MHTLTPSRATLHGVLDATIPPVIRIKSGDRVRIETLEAEWRISRPTKAGWKEGTFFPKIPGYDDGHALCGPIFVEDAHPGMTLAVKIEHVTPDDWGWSYARAQQEKELPEELFLLWDIDVRQGICKSGLGCLPLASFLGVMTVAPPGGLPMTTHIPGRHGGNLDCKEAVAGTTLYLPVLVEGALFSAGDGHAVQANGESGGTAVECPMKEVILHFSLLPGSIESPVLQNEQGIFTFGFDEQLNVAAKQALAHLYHILESRRGFNRTQAMTICSMGADLSITQMVNGVCGVHAFCPKALL